MIKKKNVIEIKTHENLCGNIPDPIPEKKAIPDWYKKLGRKLGSLQLEDHLGTIRVNQPLTMKECPPILDYMCTGYVLPAITDFYMLPLDKSENGIKHIGAPALDYPYITFHFKEQIDGTILEGKDVFKINSPWNIKTPPGYSCLFIKPFYADTKGINILPAIVDTDLHYTTNFPFTYEPTKDGFVPLGTPLVQVIPFKRESWKQELKEISNTLYNKTRIKTTTMVYGFYRKLTEKNKRDFT